MKLRSFFSHSLLALALATVAAGSLLALVPPGKATVQREPTIVISPSSGPCDATLEVRGNGFPRPHGPPGTLRLYLLRPGTADVSMGILNPAFVEADGTFSQWAPMYEFGCAAAELDSRAPEPSGHLFVAASSSFEETGVRPGERIPNIIAVAQYEYTTTTVHVPTETLDLFPPSGPCDATIEAKGTGFEPDVAIRLDIGNPGGEGKLGKVGSLTTDSVGSFSTTIELGPVGCQAASLVEQLGTGSLELWIVVDLEQRVIERGQGIPPILTRTPYTFTTVSVGAAPGTLPVTGHGPGPSGMSLLRVLAFVALASVGLTIVVAAYWRGRTGRSGLP